MSLRQRLPGTKLCEELIDAIRPIKLAAVQEDFSRSRLLSYFVLGTGGIFLILWSCLVWARFCIHKSLLSRRISSWACSIAALISAILLGVSLIRALHPSSKTIPVTELANTTTYTALMLLTDCVGKFHASATEEMYAIARLSDSRIEAATWISVSLLLVSIFMLIFSVLSLVLWECGKGRVKRDVEAWYEEEIQKESSNSHKNSCCAVNADGEGDRDIDPWEGTPPPEERDDECLRRALTEVGSRENSPDICEICFDRSKIMSRINVCGHEFHTDCVISWMKKSERPACPVCKMPVPLAPVVREEYVL